MSQHPTVPLEDPDAVLFCGREGPQEVRRTRVVLRLRFLHGYTAVEIGQALGLTPGNVRVLQLRALRRAATHLNPEASVRAEASVEETGPMDDQKCQWNKRGCQGVAPYGDKADHGGKEGHLQDSTRMFCSA